MSPKGTLKFLRNRHIKFFHRCLNILPYNTVSYDTSRMTVLFFILSGLDLLNSIEDTIDQKKNLIDWIYSLQVLPIQGSAEVGGFRGGFCLLRSKTKSDTESEGFEKELDCGHIAMTYTALASLIILGDDLSKVDRDAIKAHISSLQCKDGSFFSTIGGSENDMRFVYCAAAICYMLSDFSSIDIESAVLYINSSRSIEDGLGQGPFLEAHGGSTYCGIAALHLMGKLESMPLKQRDGLIQWLIKKQDTLEGGLKGRPNKPADTCYSFWIGASLKLLGAYELMNQGSLLQFVLAAQDPITGGIGKYIDASPDGLHTYLGISGLALMNEHRQELELNSVDPALNLSQRAFKHLKKLHETWQNSSDKYSDNTDNLFHFSLHKKLGK